MSLSPAAMRRLMKEMVSFRTTPPDGIRLITNDENILDFTGVIAGPEGTPYEGGYFKIKFQFTEEFPAAPPKCTLITKIFHPNVSKQGEICVNTLKKDWKREYGIEHILVTIKCLLIYPNAESALDEAAGKLLLEDYDEYFKHAKLITTIHAKPKVRPVEFDTPSASESSTPSTSSAASSSGTTPRIPSEPKSIPPSKSLPVASLPTSIPSSASLSAYLGAPPDPLQLSPSNTNAHLPMSTSLPPTDNKAGPLQPSSGTNGIVSAGTPGAAKPLSTGTVNAGGPGGPGSGPGGVGSAAGASAGLKRTAVTGGVAKRKKGLKRL